MRGGNALFLFYTMPIPTIKYKCQFKCYATPLSDIKAMESHEKKCGKNPENKTCRTCKNETYIKEYGDFSPYMVRGCKLEIMNDFIKENEEFLVNRYTSTHQVAPIYNCPNYNQDTESENTNDFLSELLSKLNGEYQKQKYTESENTNDFLSELLSKLNG